MRVALPLAAAALTAAWALAHLIPTRRIVSGFGDIGTENRRVITMEWIFEGVTLASAGVLATSSLFCAARRCWSYSTARLDGRRARLVPDG